MRFLMIVMLLINPVVVYATETLRPDNSVIKIYDFSPGSVPPLGEGGLQIMQEFGLAGNFKFKLNGYNGREYIAEAEVFLLDRYNNRYPLSYSRFDINSIVERGDLGFVVMADFERSTLNNIPNGDYNIMFAFRTGSHDVRHSVVNVTVNGFKDEDKLQILSDVSSLDLTAIIRGGEIREPIKVCLLAGSKQEAEIAIMEPTELKNDGHILPYSLELRGGDYSRHLIAPGHPLKIPSLSTLYGWRSENVSSCLDYEMIFSMPAFESQRRVAGRYNQQLTLVLSQSI